MLTRDQIVDLLTAAAAYDSRGVAEAPIMAWGEAAARGRWDFKSALDAIHEHYARTTEFLMPGHITEALHRDRVQPVRLNDHRAIPSGKVPASLERVGQVIAEITADLGWAREIDHRVTSTVRCPYCHAQPGYPCTRPSKRKRTDGDDIGTTPMTHFHPARTETAQTRTEGNHP